MDYDKLKNELVNDPLGIGYSALTDADASVALNAKNRVVVEETFVNAKTVMATLGATAGATFLDALASAAASNRAISWAMDFIKSDSGIDVGNTETRNMLDSLVAANVLNSADVATVKSLAEKTVSRGEELGLGLVKPGDVSYARSI